MKRKTAILLFMIFCIFLILSAILISMYFNYVERQNLFDANKTFTVANWNMQIFGDKKASDPMLMDIYLSIIQNFDIIVLQEIRDMDASSFYTLCASLPEYNCNISSRAGRSPSKEQYGVIYLKDYTLTSVQDHNPDSQDRWERPPYEMEFDVRGYNVTIFTIHTKPDDTPNELKHLEFIGFDNSENLILIGDMNADCNYLNDRAGIFSSWRWIISDDRDTTATNSDCAYDRIIVNNNAYPEVAEYGIYTKSITQDVSDHYLVWARLRDHEHQINTSFSAFMHEAFKI